MEVLQGIQESSPLSRAFFSECNIQQMNDLIRYNIWVMSDKKYKIGNQDVSQLKMIMRSVYLQEALNQPTNIQDQVNDLNKSILEYILPRLMSEIKQYVEYNKEINSERTIMPHSINLSMKGSRSLEQKPFF
tara:strand:- start:10243 stop:10638 length:396 start_codon:yes stop_codon:yes gene_type:complete